MPLDSRGKGSELRIAEQAAAKVAVHNALDEAVHSLIKTCEGRCPIRGSPRDHQVNLGIKLVSPQPSRSEWLVLQILAKVMMEATRKDEDSGRSPAKRHDRHPLMSWVVDPGDDNTTTKNKGLSRALDLVELTRRVTRLAVSRLDGRELRSE